MLFKYENDLYYYELQFDSFGLHILTRFKNEMSSTVGTGFQIKDNKIVWHSLNMEMLHLTPDAINYANRLLKQKAFW